MEKKLDGKNAASNIEQVLEAALHKAATVRPLTTHHENYPSLTNQTCCYIVIYIFIQHHNDTIIKTHEGRKTQEELRCRKEGRKEDFFNKIYTSHFICKVCV